MAADSVGLRDLLNTGLSLGSPNATAKTTSVVGGMFASFLRSALTLDPGARPLRTQSHVSAAAALWRETNSAIGSATAAGSVVTEK